MDVHLALAAPTPEVRRAIIAPLLHFNEIATGLTDASAPLAIVLKTVPSDEIVGGVWGYFHFNYLHVDLLFVPQQLRRQGFGAALLRLAEDEALRHGCTGVLLDTYSFQAPGFYVNQGYVQIGSIPDYPIGHTKILLRKRLGDSGSE